MNGDVDMLLEIKNNIEGRTICAFGEARLMAGAGVRHEIQG